MNRDSIFDNRQQLPLSGAAMLTVGIFIAAIAPPLGLLVIVIGILRVRSYRRGRRRLQHLLYQEAVEKRRRQRLMALKAMP